MRNLIITLFLMTLPASVYAAKYKVTDLGVLGEGSGISSEATSINNSGQIVGASSFQLPGLTASLVTNQAFLYENGIMKSLGTLGGRDSIAYSINDQKVIVGASATSFETTTAFLYGNGMMTVLDTLRAGNSVATAINENGQIVGYSLNSSSQNIEAFLYEDGIIKSLGTLDRSGNSRAYSINDKGQIVGESRISSGTSEAFLYENGAMKGLGKLSETGSSLAFSINERGQIVGKTTNLSGLDEAFLYENGELKALGVLNGYESSSALSINNKEQIVGIIGDESGKVSEAFLYENEQFFRLNDLLLNPESAWQLIQANAINDKGQIVGYGILNRQKRAFLLDPLPEVSIRGDAKVKEGDMIQFDVEFELNPNQPVDVTILLGADSEITLESPVETNDNLTIPEDTSIRNVDYEGTRVFDVNGNVLAIVKEEGRFTLNGLTGNTRFYVQTIQESKNNEGTEKLTAILDSVSEGAVLAEKPTDQFASVSIEDVLVPVISIQSDTNVKEGEFARFEVALDIDPLSPIDVTILLGVDNDLILSSSANSNETLVIPADTATRSIDYDGKKVYDAQGNLLAVSDQNNRFTLSGLTANQEIYIQTQQDFENNEDTEVVTAVLVGVGEGAILTDVLDDQFSSIFIEEVTVPKVSVFSNANVNEGDFSKFDVGFSAAQQSPLNITFRLGDLGDSAKFGEDYDAVQVYDANGLVLAAVAENGDFVLENVTDSTSFFVRTLKDQNPNEGNEFFSVILMEYTDGQNQIIPDPQPSARAIIKDRAFDISLFSNADTSEGDFAQFDVEFSFDPPTPLDLIFKLGSVDDTATPGEDYDAMQVYDAAGNVIATVGENNEFTLENVLETTGFFVKTSKDSNIKELNEFFTVILVAYSDGQNQVTPDPKPSAQGNIRNQTFNIFIRSSSNGIEGYSAKFDIEFDVPPEFPVDVTISLGAEEDTATLGIDYERSRIYDSHFFPRSPLATANGNEFTLKGLKGSTSFYVQTFQERIAGEGRETFTVALVSYKIGEDTFIFETMNSADAGIEELQDPELISVSSNLDVYIPNFVQIFEAKDDFFWMTLKHAGGNIWKLSGIAVKPHNPDSIFYATAPPSRDITIYSAQLMDLPLGRTIFAKLMYLGPNTEGDLQWELIEAREIE